MSVHLINYIYIHTCVPGQKNLHLFRISYLLLFSLGSFIQNICRLQNTQLLWDRLYKGNCIPILQCPDYLWNFRYLEL
jgi:hypothetical protein